MFARPKSDAPARSYSIFHVWMFYEMAFTVLGLCYAAEFFLDNFEEKGQSAFRAILLPGHLASWVVIFITTLLAVCYNRLSVLTNEQLEAYFWSPPIRWSIVLFGAIMLRVQLFLSAVVGPYPAMFWFLLALVAWFTVCLSGGQLLRHRRLKLAGETDARPFQLSIANLLGTTMVMAIAIPLEQFLLLGR